MSISPSTSPLSTQPNDEKGGGLIMLDVVLQQFILPSVLWLICVPFSWNPSIGSSGTPLLAIHAAIGALAGVLVGRGWSSLIEIGRYIWVLPTVMWTLVLIDEYRRKGFVQAIEVVFCGTAASEGLAVGLITTPALICIGYSLGMFMARRMIS